jgi:hypothetical protein
MRLTSRSIWRLTKFDGSSFFVKLQGAVLNFYHLPIFLGQNSLFKIKSVSAQWLRLKIDICMYISGLLLFCPQQLIVTFTPCLSLLDFWHIECPLFFFQFWNIKFKKSKNQFDFEIDFAGYTGSKNQVRTWQKIKFVPKSIFFSRL